VTVNVGPEKLSMAMPPINPAIDALNLEFKPFETRKLTTIGELSI
jgi:hypothetical protein